jgi:hypothetical protein
MLMTLEGSEATVRGLDAPPEIVRAFDYSSLSDDVAKEARAVAERVRARQQGHIAAIIETGRDLAAVKERLEHGQFTAWLQAEFGMTDRTARNYMQASAQFDGKTEIISDLPPTTIYQLSAPSTPAPIREAVIQRLEAGERVEPRDVHNMVWEAKQKAKEARADAKLTEGQRKRRVKREEKRRQEAEQWQHELEERKRQQEGAIVRARDLIVSSLGGNLPVLAEQMALLDSGGLMHLRQAIVNIARQGENH